MYDSSDIDIAQTDLQKVNGHLTNLVFKSGDLNLGIRNVSSKQRKFIDDTNLLDDDMDICLANANSMSSKFNNVLSLKGRLENQLQRIQNLKDRV